MRSGGRTILFVSHNLSALRVICQRGLLLEGGRLIQDGPINEVIDSYLTRLGGEGEGCSEKCETESFIVETASVRSLSGSVIKTFDCIEIKVQIRPKVAIGEAGVYVGILSSENFRVSGLGSGTPTWLRTRFEIKTKTKIKGGRTGESAPHI